MKLPGALSKLFRPKPETRELLLSMLIEPDAVSAAAWELGRSGKPVLHKTATVEVSEATWEGRTEAADRVIAAAEDRAGAPSAIVKAVLGLPAIYLTDSGDIAKEVRSSIRELMKTLELSPVGFVPIHQAIAYLIKAEEGIPANIILLSVSTERITVTLYKIGNLVGQRTVPRTDEVSRAVEEVLRSFDGDDVLPSRMLLHGPDGHLLESVKANLLTHPWPTRVNFLHYPKIEVLSQNTVVRSVSLAGAYELTGAMPSEEDAVSVEPSPAGKPQGKGEETKREEDWQEGSRGEEAAEQDRGEETPVVTERESEEEKEPNVVMVAPEELGFEKADVLETAAVKQQTLKRQQEKREREQREEDEQYHPRMLLLKVIRLRLGAFLPKVRIATLSAMLPAISVSWLPLAAVIAVILLAFGFWYWFFPRATVTVFVLPSRLSQAATVSVDPTATVVDSTEKIIPGAKQEKVVSGEKTLPVTGKKNVGETARGTVTIYNKVTTPRSLKKGATLTSRGLSFSLDDDVTVASASETIGSITFGKATAAMTASDIGPQSNLPAGTEFAFKDLGTSVIVARNEQPFTGGTSREVTVVSRADYDALTKALSAELVAKAKEELAGSLGGGTLIDATVKTALTERSFTQELDEESSVVSGKVTITMTGLSFREEDLKTVLTELVGQGVPAGYSLSSGRTSVTVRDAKVAKDGRVVLTATLESLALPDITTDVVRKLLSGKKLSGTLEALRGVTGVAGASFDFRWTPWKDRMPVNPANISVTVAIQE